MTKQDIIRDMKTFLKDERDARAKSDKKNSASSPCSFITQAAIMRYWGRSKGAVRDLVKDLECDKTGRDYKYFVPDVAEKIMERMTM